MTLAGHADLESRLRSTMDLLFPGSQRALEVVEVEFVPLGPDTTIRVGAAFVEVFEVQHFCGAPPFALRLTTPTGTIVSYSGDTEWTDNLLRASDDADLFIVEAYSYDKKIKWHLDYASLAENLSRITAQQIVATHMSADMLTRLDDVAVPTASDGEVLEL